MPGRLPILTEENNFHWGVSAKPLLDTVATRGIGTGADGRVRGRYKNGVETVLYENNLTMDTHTSADIPVIFTEKGGFDYIGNITGGFDHERAYTVADMCPESRES